MTLHIYNGYMEMIKNYIHLLISGELLHPENIPLTRLSINM